MTTPVCLACVARERAEAQDLRNAIDAFLASQNAADIDAAAMERLGWDGDGTLTAVILSILRERVGVVAPDIPQNAE